MSLRMNLAVLGLLSSLSVVADPVDDEWNEEWQDEWESEEQQSGPSGFIELGLGGRLDRDSSRQRQETLQDIRAHLEWDYVEDDRGVDVNIDVWYDGVTGALQSDIRQLSASFSNVDTHFLKVGVLDIKVGRQILTWGVGDYLFLNDLFPKDWQSFFSGRDDDYLKAPSTALKASWWSDYVNIDVVRILDIDSDNFINGEYFSFYSSQAGQQVAPEFSVDDPSGGEWSLRVSKQIGATEWALYGHDGVYRNPDALTISGEPYFSRMSSWGMSVISPAGSGLVKAEFSRYRSDNDPDGSNPLVPNSQDRLLIGFERELATNVTGSVQAYVEHTRDHGVLKQLALANQLIPSMNRTVITSSVNWRSMQNNLTVRLFNFFSPSDDDGYLRFSAQYRVNDAIQLTTGMNWFYGENTSSFFGQFEQASNLYVRFRYHFDTN